VRKPRSSTAIWRHEELKCVWAWKPVDTDAGSNDCWGAEHRVVDWRRGEDPSEAGTQAEDRSRGCPAHSETHAEGRFSADLGSQLGQS